MRRALAATRSAFRCPALLKQRNGVRVGQDFRAGKIFSVIAVLGKRSRWQTSARVGKLFVKSNMAPFAPEEVGLMSRGSMAKEAGSAVRPFLIDRACQLETGLTHSQQTTRLFLIVAESRFLQSRPVSRLIKPADSNESRITNYGGITGE